jgi:D-alanyl-D-alanine carboxypeptidase/D-alanyl-D-alanine-endopeptidase (penicillin-binding protein 4)
MKRFVLAAILLASQARLALALAHPAPAHRAPAQPAPAQPAPAQPAPAQPAPTSGPVSGSADQEPPAPLTPLTPDASELGARIGARIQAALADPSLVGAGLGVTVRDLRDGSLIFEKNGNMPLKPASNMKLVTGSAAQDLLGPERVLLTKFRSDRAPDRSGAVGTLYVVGGGDPSLTIEGLYLAARAIAMRGVRKVDRVVVDDSFFGGTTRPPSWPERNGATWYGAPSSALGVNFNVVAVHARGGAKNGEPAATWLDPFPDFFDLSSTVRTGGGGVAAKGTIVARPDGSMAQRLTVTGRVRPKRTVRILVPVEDPALFCGYGVAESLRRVGIDVAGGVSRGTLPARSVLLHEHASRPMSELIRDMNKPSSNVFAETLLKVLGAEMHGAPGTREKGDEVLRSWLELVSPGGCTCHLVDGSGLSPEDRLTTRMLTDLLLHQSAQSASFPEYLSSLPVAGADGTLRKRFRNSHAKRLVRAKTGRINQVAALLGYAQIGEGRRAVFSILLNGYHSPSWKAEAAVDRVVEAMVLDAPEAPDPRKLLNLTPLPEEPDGEEGEAADEAGAPGEDSGEAAPASGPQADDGGESGETTEPENETDGQDEQRPPG